MIPKSVIENGKVQLDKLEKAINEKMKEETKPCPKCGEKMHKYWDINYKKYFWVCGVCWNSEEE